MQGLVPSPWKVIQKSQTFTILNSEATDSVLVVRMSSVLKSPFPLVFVEQALLFFSPQYCKLHIKETQEDGNKDE